MKSKKKWNNDRSKAQNALQIGLKLHILNKYPTQSITDTILIGFNASETLEITLSGWMGQLLKDLPSRAYTLEELTEGFSFKVFP
jgi:hypothetical protein